MQTAPLLRAVGLLCRLVFSLDCSMNVSLWTVFVRDDVAVSDDFGEPHHATEGLSQGRLQSIFPACILDMSWDTSESLARPHGRRI